MNNIVYNLTSKTAFFNIAKLQINKSINNNKYVYYSPHNTKQYKKLSRDILQYVVV